MEEGRLITTKYEATSCRLVLSTVVACLGSFSFGFTIGYSSPALPQMKKDLVFPHESDAAWFVSLLTLGGLCGGLLAGWCLDKFGRKKTLLFTSIPFILGWISIAKLILHQEDKLLYIGRFLTGLASGMVTVTVPVYIAEISTNSKRGFFGSCNQLCITIGILAAFTLGASHSWVDLAEIAFIPPIISLIGIIYIPETPRWLLTHKRNVSALQALRLLRGPHADVQMECNDLEESLAKKEKPFSFAEFKESHLRRPLIIGVLIMVFQQFSGINAILFYTVEIFESAGFGTLADKKSSAGFSSSDQAAILVGIVQVVATAISCCLVDKLGRRSLFNISGVLMTLTTFTLGLYFFLGKRLPFNGFAHHSGALFCLIVYIIGFSLGWGPLPMLIMSEIFPSRCRGLASAFAIVANWSCAFVISMAFIQLQVFIGIGMTFWLFTISCIVSIVFVMRYVPETKGKSLEEIELYFARKI